MKTLFLFTNSKTLSDEFNLPYLLEDHNTLNKAEQCIKTNEDNLLKDALEQSIEEYSREDIFIVLEENDTIIGGIVLGYNENGWSFCINHKWAVKSISIFNQYKGNNYSRILIEYLFLFLLEHNISFLKQSSYTEDGKLKIAHIFKEINKIHPTINYIDA